MKWIKEFVKAGITDLAVKKRFETRLLVRPVNIPRVLALQGM